MQARGGGDVDLVVGALVGVIIVWAGSEDEVLMTSLVLLEAIDTVAEAVGLAAETMDDGMLLVVPVPEALSITPHADGFSQLNAISSTDEIAAELTLMEGSIAMLAKVTWLRVHSEAQLDTEEDTELPDDMDGVLMAVLEAIRELELD